MDGLSAKFTILGTIPGLRVDDRAHVDGVVAEVCPDVVRSCGEFVDRLCDQCESVTPIQLLAREDAIDRLVDRPVTCFVNYFERCVCESIIPPIIVDKKDSSQDRTERQTRRTSSRDDCTNEPM